MDINKIKTLKNAIKDLEKREKSFENAINSSKKKEISLLKSMEIDPTKSSKVVYKKPKWRKKIDSFITKIEYLLWKIGLYR